ncbi:MAG: hypothetical protein ACRCZZ_07395 [Phocaeicola sp.]
MNERINLAELLEGCEGATIYSKVHGYVKINSISKELTYGIRITMENGNESSTTRFGELFESVGECILCPSKEQRDWSKWEAEREAEIASKMEYQFKPFEKVLVRDENTEEWFCDLFSHISEIDGCIFSRGSFSWKQCIPYEGNEHLVGKTDNV